MDRAILEQALAELHERSFSFALACCGWERQEAEDVLQTAYLKVLEGARYEGRSSVKTWLFAIIRKTAADRRRRHWFARLGRTRLAAIAAADGTGATPTGVDSSARVRAALAELAVRQREVLDLVFFHDLTIEEAARVMGVAVGTARIHYERGKQHLRERLR